MTMRVPLEPKTPDEEKDYGIDWRKWIATDVTISTSVWELPTGITRVTDSIDGRQTLIRLAGGTAGTTYELINEIVTSVGENLERSIEVRVMTPAQVLAL
jgi:hypothetical protein